MSQYQPETGTPAEIERRDELIELFVAAAKPRDRWGIGTEYEKVAVRVEDGLAVPYLGPRGIEVLLKRLAERYGWDPIEEAGHIVALHRDRASITLEPGGQVELSGEICDSVHCAQAEFSRHIDEVVTIGDEMGIAFLGLGMQPVSIVSESAFVPKRRYRIMGPHMQRVGTLGQRMMGETATVQVNLDYGDEADAMMKMRVGMGLAPLLAAMFANSPLSGGELNGFMSYRGHIWTRTDPARSGLLPFVFRDSAGFEDYVEYALDVPMYFIVRQGTWHDMTAHTFRDFMTNGYQGHRATLSDWNSHLTTLFPEVRLKGYIELRSTDSQSPELMLAVPALTKGIFYEPDCLTAAWDLVKSWTWDERNELTHAVHREALRARIRRMALAEIARELVSIALEGLHRQHSVDARGNDESVYLEPLADLVRAGVCPADAVIERWMGAWGQEISQLVLGSSYRIAA